MSPFRSKAQQRAAFSGALGPKMKKKAKLWAEHTPNIEDLPEHADAEKSFWLPEWEGEVMSLDMAYDLKKAERSEERKGLAQWKRDYESAKKAGNMKLANQMKSNIDRAEHKLQWQKRTKTGKIVTAHRRKNILQQVKEATKQGLLKPGLSMSSSKWKEYLAKREIEMGN
jgi:hypothetical protein